MRIISSFHDYYDSVQSFGQDDLIYLREERTEEIDIKFETVGGYWNSLVDCRTRLIGFCGKAYPVIVFDPQQLSGSNTAPDVYNCYSIEDIDLCIEAYAKKRAKKEYYEKRSRYSSDLRTDFVDHFNYYKTPRAQKPFVELFERFKSPIYTARKVRRKSDIEFTVNAALKPYEFVRIKDVYTAFQDVSMFVGNIAMPEKPIPTVDDKTMAQIKGFDKFSFRKEKAGS